MHRTRTFFGIGVALVALSVSACTVQLKNAPPGGGDVEVATFRLGPFDLGAMGMASGYEVSIPKPAGAFGLKSASFTIVDEAGDEVSAHHVHLHHILLIDPDTTDVVCPGRGERFAGSGAERTPIAIPDPYAYMVDAGERVDALYHVMNMMPAPKTVYIEYTLGYQPGATTENTRPVTPYFLDVTGCGNSEYDVPGDGGPGSVHLLQRSWTSPAKGIAVFAGGHQHGGGLGLKLRHVESGIVGCKSVPVYDEMGLDGHPVEMTSCTMHKTVAAGKTYRIESSYDNSKPRPDVMGIMLAYVWHGTQ